MCACVCRRAYTCGTQNAAAISNGAGICWNMWINRFLITYKFSLKKKPFFFHCTHRAHYYKLPDATHWLQPFSPDSRHQFRVEPVGAMDSRSWSSILKSPILAELTLYEQDFLISILEFGQLIKINSELVAHSPLNWCAICRSGYMLARLQGDLKLSEQHPNHTKKLTSCFLKI